MQSAVKKIPEIDEYSEAQEFKARILVADDDESVHLYFKRVLNSIPGDGTEGSRQCSAFPEYAVDFVYSGQQALQKIKEAIAEGKPYSVVFIDYRMKGDKNGLQTIRNIREFTDESEFVLCTSAPDVGWEKVFEEVGVSDRVLLLKKPLEPATIKQMAMALTSKTMMRRKHRGYLNELEKTAQERLDELSLEKAKNWHNAKMISLGEMAGGIAHEINNPLAIIDGNADLAEKFIEEGADKSRTIDRVRKIRQVVARIKSIVDSLLKLSGKDYQADPEDILVQEILDQTMTLGRQKVKNSEVKIDIDIPSGLTICCVETQLVQVLLNLLTNAIDAAVATDDPWLKFEAKTYEAGTEIRASNSGDPIDPEIVNKIFDPFFTTKDVGKGTGLGLSISRSIVSSLGGEMFVDGERSYPSFVVRLPNKVKE